MRLIKLFRVFYTLCSYFFLVAFSNNKRKVSKLTSKYSKKILQILDIEINIDSPAFFDKNNCLIVSNHISYVDILVISSIINCAFVTSTDVEKQFFLGFVSKLANSIFVSRKVFKISRKDVINIARTIAHNCPVCIFPEATSTDGEKILKFRSSLFESIVILNVVVLPVYIKYSNNKVAYFGKMKFFSHLWNLLKEKDIIVSVSFCEPIFTKKIINEITEISTRQEVCKKAYNSIVLKSGGSV